jgi:hypothetical protein
VRFSKVSDINPCKSGHGEGFGIPAIPSGHEDNLIPTIEAFIADGEETEWITGWIRTQSADN